MGCHNQGAAFIDRISAEALGSTAVNHPYLRAFREGAFPNIELAYRDFAYQYGFYSAGFTRYVSAVIDSVANPSHRQLLQKNLEEELGDTHGVELPSDIHKTVFGLPHTELFSRFQEALGVDNAYRESTPRCQTALLWSRQFLQLCESGQCVGIGAIGPGTELIVSQIYNQILEGLKAHSGLTVAQRVFFDLHSKCDDEHAAQMASIAVNLARDAEAREQIEYGTRMAILLRTLFWDKMLERAQAFPASNLTADESQSILGYQESLQR